MQIATMMFPMMLSQFDLMSIKVGHFSIENHRFSGAIPTLSLRFQSKTVGLPFDTRNSDIGQASSPPGWSTQCGNEVL